MFEKKKKRDKMQKWCYKICLSSSLDYLAFTLTKKEPQDALSRQSDPAFDRKGCFALEISVFSSNYEASTQQFTLSLQLNFRI